MLLPSTPRPLLTSKPPFFFHSQHNKFRHFFTNNPNPPHMGTHSLSPTKPSSSSSSPIEAHRITAPTISLQEWQGWGTNSPVPSMVYQVIQDLKLLEKDIDADMTFGGNHGRLSGDFKVHEDKKHRAKYATLVTSEEKLQFFSARQIACRLLGSRGYLCQKCWLPLGDCMCSRITMCSLWHRVRIWLYMHPKDFLRQNNTGKLLWQVFGVQAATLCLFGITEHEEMMWNELNLAGKNKVWCLYPNKNAAPESVKDSVPHDICRDQESDAVMANEDDTMHFILLDGTWNNSSAMFKRLQDRAELIWGQDLRCISLNTGVSLMHKLRPQPSWDRTCTAAAAIGLLYELHLLKEFSSFGLDKQAESIEDALEVLLEALTTRRLRMGRSISRAEKHKRDIC